MKLINKIAYDARKNHYDKRDLGCEGSYGCCYDEGYVEGFLKVREVAVHFIRE